MRKIYITFIIAMLLVFYASAQVNVKNDGVLYISSFDTLFINGEFINSAGANLNNDGNFYVKENITNNQSSLAAGEGTLYLTGTASQNVGGSQRLNTYNFVIDNFAGITLSNNMSIKRTFKLTNGNFALNSNNVTLLSDINNTANVSPLGGTASITYGTGRFVVERFIRSPRAWRLLTAPITTTTQTINDAWQEGQTGTSNNLPGYGTHITGGSLSNGFDQGVNSNAGIKEYNAGAWTNIPNTNATLITNKPGYMVFVRGDRGTNLSQGTGAAPSNTILRTTGRLKTGTQSYTVAAAGFTLVGNPYASAIDLDQIGKSNSTNIQDNFYLWDPKITGSNGVGGFVNISWNGLSYDVTPSSGGSGLTQFVPSGTAFLVKTANGSTTGNLVIKETDKVSVSNMGARGAGNTSASVIKTNLYSINGDGTTSIVDGILNSFADIYSDSIDNYDAIKLNNFSETLLSVRDGNSLVAERRQPLKASDTIFLNMLQMKVKSYNFEIIAENFNNTGLSAFLEDSYFNTSTPLDLQGTTTVNFNVVNVPGSWNPNRFRIVFKQAAVLPLTFSNVKAFEQDENIRVEWKAENEVNIKEYEIEKSADGQQFVKVKTVIAEGNNNSAYKWIDEEAFEGNNYYRIKSIAVNGEMQYTSIVKVNIVKIKEEIILSSNIITNKIIILQMNNMPSGFYNISITDNLGQAMYSKKIEHQKGSTENIQLNKNFIAGIYYLNIVKPDLKRLTIKVLVK